VYSNRDRFIYFEIEKKVVMDMEDNTKHAARKTQTEGPPFGRPLKTSKGATRWYHLQIRW